MRMPRTRSGVVCVTLLALGLQPAWRAAPARAATLVSARPAVPAVVLGAVADGPTQQRALFAVAPDGTVTRFAGQVTEPFRPAWSPDGRRLGVLDGESLRILRRDGTTAATLAPASDFAWAPAGRRVARIAPSSSGPRILISRVAGGAVLDVTPEPLVDANTLLSRLSWSPDGAWIGVYREPFDALGFARPADYRLIRPDGSHQRKLFKIDVPFKDAPSDVAWAPDGRRLAVASGVFGVDAIGDAIVSVPSGAVVRLGGEGVVDFAWSPGGERLAGVDVLRAYPDTTLVVWNADGSGARELAKGMQPVVAWSGADVILTAGTPSNELWRYAWPAGGSPSVVARLPDGWSIEAIAVRPGARTP
jgi:dipeptidyl aminopeptidase/acylaminoacyl peptidase